MWGPGVTMEEFGGGAAHSEVFLAPWRRWWVKSRTPGGDGRRDGRLVAAVFSGCVCAAVVGGRSCLLAAPLLPPFGPLGLGLLLQFSVLPLGGEGRRGRRVSRQQMKRVSCTGTEEGQNSQDSRIDVSGTGSRIKPGFNHFMYYL